jgi:FMN-dependent NADH-azoreductase
MSSLLYLQASPRGADAVSSRAAAIFLEALPGSVSVDHLALFDAPLPAYDEDLAAAKYAVMSGRALTALQAARWAEVEAMVERFKAAEHYLLTVPMWNFGLPYVLKQYVDLVTHPGLTFRPAATGMEGLVGGSATVIYSRGGDYSPIDGAPNPYDLQTPYMQAWLGMVGIDPVLEIAVQGTMGGPDVVEAQLAAARPQLESQAGSLGSS